MSSGGVVTARPEALAGFGTALYRLRAARRRPLRRAAREAGVCVSTVMRAEQDGDTPVQPGKGQVPR
jgi:hypothetical protein